MLNIQDGATDKPLNPVFPQVMGILNITPDSFSDGGDFISPRSAVDKAREMIAEGAAIIDVGGESTRPGAAPVPVDEELSRVMPVIEAIHAEFPVVISIDTSKPEVMRAAVAAGAGMINDVMALRAEGAVETVRELSVPVCLMHMQGEPRTMQQAPRYQDVVAEVKSFLKERIEACVGKGLARKNLLIDPGFGFGKSLPHNLRLLRHLDVLTDLDVPILVGMSRKSMIGQLLARHSHHSPTADADTSVLTGRSPSSRFDIVSTMPSPSSSPSTPSERRLDALATVSGENDGLDVPVNERLYGSIALATLAIWQGAAIIRAHDVRATVEAVRIATAVKTTI